MGLLKIFGVEKKAEDEKTSKKVVVKVKKAGAINPEDDPLNSCNAYVDSSTVNDDEKQYYQEDEYYTYYSYPETMMARRVIPFEERKKTSYPTLNGLYVAEVLLLEYCSYGDYPKPKNGYPGFWWFAYGIRDIGHAPESLFNRGFLQWAPKKQYVKTLTVPQLKQILSDEGLSTSGKKADLVDRIMQSISEENLTLPGYTPKYELTNLGQMELEQNGYIPYMHKHKYKTTEDETFGSTFNVWSINRLFPDGDNAVVGFDDLTAAGNDQQVFLVGHQKHRFEFLQNLIGAPFLHQFHRGAHQIAPIFVELAFKFIKERESVGHSAGKAGNDLTVIQAAHFAGAVFHDHRIAHRDLTVAGHGGFAVLRHTDDRRCFKLCMFSHFHSSFFPRGWASL